MGYYYFSTEEIFLFAVAAIVAITFLGIYLYSSKSKLNFLNSSLKKSQEDNKKSTGIINNLKNNLAQLNYDSSRISEKNIILNEEVNNLTKDLKKAYAELEQANRYIKQEHENLEYFLSQKQEVMPYLAGMISDYLTLEYDRAVRYLKNKSRPALKEASRIQELKKETMRLLTEYKTYQYKLLYLYEMHPELEDYFDEDSFEETHIDYTNHDPVRDYFSKEEWMLLSDIEKNQLALERYLKRRTNAQIGRDYELYIGQLYERLGFSVEYRGMENGYYDHGQDIIAKKNSKIIIIQCKYRGRKKDGSEKEVHENSVTQLLGTLTRYSIEHNLSKDEANACLVTNKTLDEDAKKCASYLGIAYRENMEMLNFPQIKCNISKTGEKIYHLPMDQQYDKVKIDQPGECYAYTVAEAEQKGFRRAFKYTGNFAQ